tara:strand:+ start:32559 stop:32795 length:237 start_codon:yes stop_codon:yes gene_type:complete
MKIIKILGTGCAKYKAVTSLVQDVVNENNINAHIEKVEDITEILTFNVMATPAVIIDSIIAIKGRVPSKSEVFELLTQ